MEIKDKESSPSVRNDALNNAFRLRLREILQIYGLTINGLAKQSRVNKGTLSRINTEKYGNIEMKTIVRICDAVGISVREFFNSPLFDKEHKEHQDES